ncbi:hypothetical protein KP509_17G064500 [Ceratopteris richardii]|uniref:Uncharacterized protein n=1 Tax=Ceratopteris richardii TaxID=49495 RepID=A0A8T2SXN2_CERRI|nr:hypothetical protein KP509_17G064500 [Ceratopteris richardii]
MLVDSSWLESLTLARILSQRFGAVTLCQGMWLGVFSSLLLMPPFVASIALAKGAFAPLTPQARRSSRSHIWPSGKKILPLMILTPWMGQCAASMSNQTSPPLLFVPPVGMFNCCSVS